MRTSCISYPKERLVMARQSQVAICDGEFWAGALLNFFEYWHSIKIEIIEKNKKANDIAEMHGDPRAQDETPLVFFNEAELEEACLGGCTHNTIKKHLELLQKKGFVSIHKNPNARYHFDKTRYFLFHPEKVQDAINSIVVDDPKLALQSAKIGSQSTKIGATRTEITSEIIERGDSANSASSSPAPPKISEHKDRKARSVPIANPFMVVKEMRDWARERAPDIDCKLETERFVNWARSKDERKVDWLAAWKNWMLKAESEAPKRKLNSYA